MERLDAKALHKFKSVSKQWKSTIQSPCFQKRQLFRRKQSGDPCVALVSSSYGGSYPNPDIEALRTLVVGSSVSLKIPTPWENKTYSVCTSSCDGLLFLYEGCDPNIVVNPTTRWHRRFPPCNYQLVTFEKRETRHKTIYLPGFGKDKISGTYKPVWLYNSLEIDLNNNAAATTTTTCEVFDFTTNAWRYVVPASHFLILDIQDPVYVDGSLHWFTAPHEGETKVLSFDLHTEAFQVIAKAPFHHDSNQHITMCNLDDRLCVAEKEESEQVIWSLCSDHKTWSKIYSIDLDITFDSFGIYPSHALIPLAVLEEDKLLFYDTGYSPLVIHDPKTKSYDLAYTSKASHAQAICYFPSLISIF
ncbi:unnamed protein product [Microthlaspi erraticum]|uniref:Uncharacterized protein n=1 Tax=Microthlaspi erraticum TaxID=1685480 RepID=A0A6D2JGX3_9BRAS|nr:unnamed protein product [Microthlaspi erraticum]